MKLLTFLLMVLSTGLIYSAEEGVHTLAQFKTEVVGKWEYTRDKGDGSVPQKEVWEFTKDSLEVTPFLHDTKYKLLVDTDGKFWVLLSPKFEGEAIVFRAELDGNTLKLSPVIYNDEKGIMLIDKGSLTLRKIKFVEQDATPNR